MERNRERKQNLENKLNELVQNTRTTFTKEIYERSSIGTVSELYDSEEPYEARGAFAQAWSVSEIFRIVMNK